MKLTKNSVTKMLTKTTTCLFSGVVLLLFAACAEQPAVKQQQAANSCWSTGGGLTSKPNAETLKAMADEEIANKMSVSELTEAAATGDASAQVELGYRYANGDGIPKDDNRAYSLFRTAAERNHPIALFALGTAHSNGVGVPKDDAPAIAIWESAARQGYANAQYWLGFMIANGRGGVEANWCAALSLFEAAAKGGVPDAAFMIGTAFHLGKMGEPNYAEAAKWYRFASSKVLNQKAQYNLRLLIEEGHIKWQEGDPGTPSAINDSGPDHKPARQLRMKDKSADSVG